MILALESSCDETAVALFDPARGLVGEWVHSQIALHEKHGGVVPDLATREHLRHFAPLLERAKTGVGFERVDTVAVTHGPGLAACLAIGVSAAKALGLALHARVVGVNHLRGHAWSPFIAAHAEAPAEFEQRLGALLPHLGLIVSGGNTLLFALENNGGRGRETALMGEETAGHEERRMREERREREIRRSRETPPTIDAEVGGGAIRVLASTRDDAAGEALDKGAKLLGLGYPGGPLIEKLAAGGRADAFDFPRGIGRRDDLDFSFSGLKTSLRYLLEKMSPADVEKSLPDLCASYQQAVIDALTRKTRAALRRRAGEFRSLGLSGGVANNRSLRAALEAEARRERIPFLAAQPKHTGDNAGMIAFAAWADRAGIRENVAMGLRIEPSAALG